MNDCHEDECSKKNENFFFMRLNKKKKKEEVMPLIGERSVNSV
jgi:hypothetical protein